MNNVFFLILLFVVQCLLLFPFRLRCRYWKARLGKCYFKLGLFRDAEKQFRSSLKLQPIVSTYLELCNVYVRLDMPNSALDLLEEASGKFTTDARLLSYH